MTSKKKGDKNGVNESENEVKIKIYSTTTCTFCKSLTHYLNKKNINYEESVVDKDHKALHEMLEESNGFAGVPFIVITKNDCTKIKIKGFDVNQINAVLGL